MRQDTHTLITQYDSEARQQVVSIRIKPLVEPEEWPFLIGDALHDMRVAIEYLAFRVIMKKVPGADETKVAFPICSKPTNYGSLEGMRIGSNAPDDVKKAFKSLQPCFRTNSPSTDPLFLLDALENEHKHRRLLDAGFQLGGISFGVLHDPRGSLNIKIVQMNAGPFQNGDEVARYDLMSAPDPELQAEFRAPAHIAFDKEGPARGAIVLQLLDGIRDHIRKVVFPTLEPFLK
jgi:hypothetical protein